MLIFFLILIIISHDPAHIIDFLAVTPNCDVQSSALLDVLLASNVNLCSAADFPPLGNSDHVVVSVPIECLISRKKYACFQYAALIILGLVKLIFVMFSEIFHGKISLICVLLLLLSTESGFTLELMYISLIENLI